ncbi:hypothetical protein Ahu01nite_093610 [Winogradskya humida]|uniref:Methyltransferase type 11 domain-containing protein n=2 Tax=Winogradskya humida TaxID=113566 RepID=A0ABQ4A6B2_9ACTN|nr:hypothetical protein Ahu01nite_093610 [Actinoplanes humidus]
MWWLGPPHATLDHMRPLKRNDPRLYDELADQWWRPGGEFELLHWLAAARGALVPRSGRTDAILIDAGCGGGLLAPHVVGLGYRHIGVDLRSSGLEHSARRGMTVLNGDVTALPLADGIADVVVAGEILEHVTDLPATVAELCRVLRPGGLLVLDTINDTWLGRFVSITLGERFGAAPVGIHDPELFVDPGDLTTQFAKHGVRLKVRGVRPSVPGLIRWLFLPVAARGRMIPTRSTQVLYQGIGRKEDMQ